MTRGSAGLRKAVLTVHVMSSVGWFGAVLAFLVIAVLVLDAPATAMGGLDAAMLAIGRVALVPLGASALVTGVTLSLITQWGLVRHWWVLIKLVVTVVAVTVLLLYLPGLGATAAVPMHGVGRASPLLHAGAAALLLGFATVLSVAKPRGRTGFGGGPADGSGASAGTPR